MARLPSSWPRRCGPKNACWKFVSGNSILGIRSGTAQKMKTLSSMAHLFVGHILRFFQNFEILTIPRRPGRVAASRPAGWQPSSIRAGSSTSFGYARQLETPARRPSGTASEGLGYGAPFTNIQCSVW